MFDLNDLQSQKMLSNCSDLMLHKIREITFVRKYRKNDYIFHTGEYAEYLFGVIEGKITLEVLINSSNPIRVKDIYPGDAFGISSIVDTDKRNFIANAKAVQDSKVFCWKGIELEKLFYKDFEIGFLFMRSVGKILKTRLECKRAQLVQELSNSGHC